MSQGGVLSDKTSPAADIETLTGNSGGAVGPDGAFNVNVLGSNTQGINIVGVPGTNTLTASGINAAEAQIGVMALATNTEAVTGTVTNKAIVPSSLTARLAAPGPIGGTTPGTGAFTTGSFTSTTTPQLTVAYDGTHNWTHSISSTGVLTLTPTLSNGTALLLKSGGGATNSVSFSTDAAEGGFTIYSSALGGYFCSFFANSSGNAGMSNTQTAVATGIFYPMDVTNPHHLSPSNVATGGVTTTVSLGNGVYGWDDLNYFGALNNISDSRTKENIKQTTESHQEKICNVFKDLKIKTFVSKSSAEKKEKIGIIAQDLKELCDREGIDFDLIRSPKKVPHSSNKDEEVEGYMGISLNHLVFALISYVKSLHEKIEILEDNL